MPAICEDDGVVICFHFTIFVVLGTTIVLIMYGIKLL